MAIEKKKIKNVKCNECSYIIDDDETGVKIITYNRLSKPDDVVNYHFTCWVDFFNKCVEKKAGKLKDLAKIVNPKFAKEIKQFVTGTIKQDGKRRTKRRTKGKSKHK